MSRINPDRNEFVVYLLTFLTRTTKLVWIGWNKIELSLFNVFSKIAVKRNIYCNFTNQKKQMYSKFCFIKIKLFCEWLRWISWSLIQCFILTYCSWQWLKISSFYSVGQLVHNHQKCNIRHILYCYVYDEKYPRESYIFIYRLYPVNSY